jgi:membrane protein DedA with SNARE-associated domain
MFWSLLIFIIGFVFFESVLDISGVDYGIVGRAALPALLIIIGVTLLARSWQRGRGRA